MYQRKMAVEETLQMEVKDAFYEQYFFPGESYGFG